jgi:hypothetical protein
MKLLGRKTVKAEKTSAPMVMASKAAKADGGESRGGSLKGGQGPTHDEIARRSYELFLSRGGQVGHEVEDWLRAEAELRTK